MLIRRCQNQEIYLHAFYNIVSKQIMLYMVDFVDNIDLF